MVLQAIAFYLISTHNIINTFSKCNMVTDTEYKTFKWYNLDDKWTNLVRRTWTVDFQISHINKQWMANFHTVIIIRRENKINQYTAGKVNFIAVDRLPKCQPFPLEHLILMKKCNWWSIVIVGHNYYTIVV